MRVEISLLFTSILVKNNSFERSNLDAIDALISLRS